MRRHWALWIFGFLPLQLSSAFLGAVLFRMGHGGTQQTPALQFLAGSLGGSGNLDGTGSDARFSGPKGIAMDSGGNLYIVDCFNFTIRKITSSGVVTTLAGTAGAGGSADGTGAAASFYFSGGLAVDSGGNVYVTDSFYSTIRKITSSGVVTTLAGTAGVSGSADGTGAAASFNSPSGIAVDSGGNLYVTDTYNNTIRKITSSGVVTTLAGTAGVSGSADGTGAAASFNSPFGVAVDSGGNLYVTDTYNNTIRTITSSGVVTTLAGTAGVSGSADGTGAAASFNYPYSVTSGNNGNIYVSDTENSTIRKITVSGVVTTLAGMPGATGSADGIGNGASFEAPAGAAVDSGGNVYLADIYNHTVRMVTSTGVVTTLAGTAGVSGSANGTGAAARFNGPTGVALDSSGNVYVADTYNLTIRKITSSGVVTTLAGTAGVNDSADGTGAAASFNNPLGIAVDNSENVYVADTNNVTIRKITPLGVVTTLAGTAGANGSADGTGAAASFDSPVAVAVDSSGNVYVADLNNYTIRKITSSGVVTTLAGTAGAKGSADGTGAAARFQGARSLAIGGGGNLYVGDVNTVRKIDASGTVQTVIGNSSWTGIRLGVLPFASLDAVGGLAYGSGNLYITTVEAILFSAAP